MWHLRGSSFIAKSVTSLLVCGILPTTVSVCPQLTTGEQTPGLMPEEGLLLLQSSTEIELTHIPSSACSVLFPENMNNQLRLNTKKFAYT